MEAALGLLSLFLVIHNVGAHMFQVGGSGDWSVESSSSYGQWAHNSRFQVGDTVCKFHNNHSALIWRRVIFN